MKPKWKELRSADDWRLLIDETGVYPPKAEVAQEINDAPEECRFELFRVRLERFKVEIEVDGDTRTRYLVPSNYKTFWPHPVSSYVPGFNRHLEEIADSAGTDREALIGQLCSEDPVQLFRAYQDIGGYFGWHEFDQYPITLTEKELDERWDRDEPDPAAPFRYLLPNYGFSDEDGCPVYVEKGDLILYREHFQDGSHRLRWARVLNRVLRGHDGQRLPGKWLRVLTLSEIGLGAYIRWVPIEDIDHCRKAAGDLLQWFFSDGPKKIDPDTIEEMASYGSLSKGYLTGALDRLEKIGDFRKR